MVDLSQLFPDHASAHVQSSQFASNPSTIISDHPNLPATYSSADRDNLASACYTAMPSPLQSSPGNLSNPQQPQLATDMNMYMNTSERGRSVTPTIASNYPQIASPAPTLPSPRMYQQRVQNSPTLRMAYPNVNQSSIIERQNFLPSLTRQQRLVLAGMNNVSMSTALPSATVRDGYFTNYTPVPQPPNLTSSYIANHSWASLIPPPGPSTQGSQRYISQDLSSEQSNAPNVSQCSSVSPSMPPPPRPAQVGRYRVSQSPIPQHNAMSSPSQGQSLPTSTHPLQQKMKNQGYSQGDTLAQHNLPIQSMPSDFEQGSFLRSRSTSRGSISGNGNLPIPLPRDISLQPSTTSPRFNDSQTDQHMTPSQSPVPQEDARLSRSIRPTSAPSSTPLDVRYISRSQPKSLSRYSDARQGHDVSIQAHPTRPSPQAKPNIAVQADHGYRHLVSNQHNIYQEGQLGLDETANNMVPRNSFGQAIRERQVQGYRNSQDVSSQANAAQHSIPQGSNHSLRTGSAPSADHINSQQLMASPLPPLPRMYRVRRQETGGNMPPLPPAFNYDDIPRDTSSHTKTVTQSDVIDLENEQVPHRHSSCATPLPRSPNKRVSSGQLKSTRAALHSVDTSKSKEHKSKQQRSNALPPLRSFSHVPNSNDIHPSSQKDKKWGQSKSQRDSSGPIRQLISSDSRKTGQKRPPSVVDLTTDQSGSQGDSNSVQQKTISDYNESTDTRPVKRVKQTPTAFKNQDQTRQHSGKVSHRQNTSQQQKVLRRQKSSQLQTTTRQQEASQLQQESQQQQGSQQQEVSSVRQSPGNTDSPRGSSSEGTKNTDNVSLQQQAPDVHKSSGNTDSLCGNVSDSAGSMHNHSLEQPFCKPPVQNGILTERVTSVNPQELTLSQSDFDMPLDESLSRSRRSRPLDPINLILPEAEHVISLKMLEFNHSPLVSGTLTPLTFTREPEPLYLDQETVLGPNGRQYLASAIQNSETIYPIDAYKNIHHLGIYSYLGEQRKRQDNDLGVASASNAGPSVTKRIRFNEDILDATATQLRAPGMAQTTCQGFGNRKRSSDETQQTNVSKVGPAATKKVRFDEDVVGHRAAQPSAEDTIHVINPNADRSRLMNLADVRPGSRTQPTLNMSGILKRKHAGNENQHQITSNDDLPVAKKPRQDRIQLSKDDKRAPPNSVFDGIPERGLISNFYTRMSKKQASNVTPMNTNAVRSINGRPLDQVLLNDPPSKGDEHSESCAEALSISQRIKARHNAYKASVERQQEQWEKKKSEDRSERVPREMLERFPYDDTPENLERLRRELIKKYSSDEVDRFFRAMYEEHFKQLAKEYNLPFRYDSDDEGELY